MEKRYQMSPRKYMSLPAAIRMETKFGPVMITTVYEGCIYVKTPQGEPITISNVAYGLSGHLYMHGDGDWEVHPVGKENSQTISLRRPDFREGSPAAYRALREELKKVAKTFAEVHGEQFKAAAAAQINNRIGDVEKEIAKGEAKLKELYEEKQGLLRREKELLEDEPSPSAPGVRF